MGQFLPAPSPTPRESIGVSTTARVWSMTGGHRPAARWDVRSLVGHTARLAADGGEYLSRPAASAYGRVGGRVLPGDGAIATDPAVAARDADRRRSPDVNPACRCGRDRRSCASVGLRLRGQRGGHHDRWRHAAQRLPTDPHVRARRAHRRSQDGAGPAARCARDGCGQGTRFGCSTRPLRGPSRTAPACRHRPGKGYQPTTRFCDPSHRRAVFHTLRGVCGSPDPRTHAHRPQVCGGPMWSIPGCWTDRRDARGDVRSLRFGNGEGCRVTLRDGSVPPLRLDDDVYVEREYHATLAAEIFACGGQWTGSDYYAEPADIVAEVNRVNATALRVSLRDLTPLREVAGLWHLDVGSDGSPALGSISTLTGLRSLHLSVRGIPRGRGPVVTARAAVAHDAARREGRSPILASLAQGHPTIEHLRVRETKIRSLREVVANLPAIAVALGVLHRLHPLARRPHLRGRHTHRAAYADACPACAPSRDRDRITSGAPQSVVRRRHGSHPARRSATPARGRRHHGRRRANHRRRRRASTTSQLAHHRQDSRWRDERDRNLPACQPPTTARSPGRWCETPLDWLGGTRIHAQRWRGARAMMSSTRWIVVAAAVLVAVLIALLVVYSGGDGGGRVAVATDRIRRSWSFGVTTGGRVAQKVTQSR